MAGGKRKDGGANAVRLMIAGGQDVSPPGGEPPADEKPVIRCSPGKIPTALEELESVVLAARPQAGSPYQRGGRIEHIVERPMRRSDGKVEMQPAIAPMEPAAFAAWVAGLATFEKWDVRANDWRRIDPPTKLIEAYYARQRWQLPVLRGLLFGPTLRADGSLLHRRGYDARTGLYLVEEV